MKKLVLFVFIAFSFGAQAQNFWSEVVPFSDSNYSARQIAIVNASTIWVYGQAFNNPSQKWSRSTDGGITWTDGDINLGDSNLIVSQLHATSETTAYVTAFSMEPSVVSGGIWFTQDGGLHWSQQSNAFNAYASFPNFIHFWDATKGIAVGDPIDGYFEIYTTTDGGANWTRLNSSPAITPIAPAEYGLTGLFKTNGNNIWFGSTYGRILHSADRGLTWAVSQSPIADFGGGINGSDTGDIAFITATMGLLQTETFSLYKTTDGGSSWSPITPSGAFRNFSITQVPGTSSTYFSIGRDLNNSPGSSYSSDNGLSWIDLSTVDANPVFPEAVKFQSGTVGFCIGNYVSDNPSAQKKFFRLTDPLNLLLKTDTFESNSITLSPNPTSGITKITGVSINEVTVFDVTGKEVYSNQYNALNEVSVNISALQNGMYLTKITDVNGNTATKKILKN